MHLPSRIVTEPSRSSCTIPATASSAVVLPTPFGPASTVTVPGRAMALRLLGRTPSRPGAERCSNTTVGALWTLGVLLDDVPSVAPSTASEVVSVEFGVWLASLASSSVTSVAATTPS